VQRLCDRLALIKEGSIIRIDEVSQINKEAYRKFRVVSDSLTEVDFQIEGVSDIKRQEQEITFYHSGNINDVIKVVSGTNLIDMQIEEPDLEEIFLHYYH